MIEVLGRQLEHRGRIAPDARVVEHDVEAPEVGDGPRDGGFDIGLQRNIAVLIEHAVAELAGERPTEIVRYVGDHHLGPLRAEEPDRGLPETAGPSRDDGDLAFQPRHPQFAPFPCVDRTESTIPGSRQ